jgi:hypothetical protein
MFRTLTKTVLVFATLLGTSPAVAWETGERQKYRQFYQNVSAQDLPTLIYGKVWVDYDSETDILGVNVFSEKDRYFLCSVEDKRTGTFGWASVVFDNKVSEERYPLWQETDPNGDVGYVAFKYIANTGQFISYLAQRPYWWETRPGHLQTEIPAAVYTACPDFPSAESLGLKVNTRQTSTRYSEMIAQDPGNRVRRPDLVTEVTVERY